MFTLKHLSSLTGLMLLCGLNLEARPFLSVRELKGSDSEHLANHLSSVYQAPDGMIWIGTFDGLCKYDGASFRKFKSPLTDNNRIDDIIAGPEGYFLCYSGGNFLPFAPESERFTDSGLLDSLDFQVQYTGKRRYPASYLYNDPTGLTWQIAPYEGTIRYYDSASGVFRDPVNPYFPSGEIRNFFQDRQGNLWFVLDRDIELVSLWNPASDFVAMEGEDVTSAKFISGRLWVGTREGVVHIYDDGMQLAGALDSAGNIVTRGDKAFAPSAIYAVEEGNDGDVWIGSRYDGLYRLQGGPERYSVTHYGAEFFARPDVMAVRCDSRSRIWVATFRGGLELWTGDGFIHFLDGIRVRSITEHGSGILLIGTGDGFYVVDARSDSPGEFPIHRHTRDEKRPGSLPFNDITSICVCPSGEVWLTTANEGICRLESADILSDELTFKSFHTRDGLASDVALNIFCGDDGILYVSGERDLTRIDPSDMSFCAFRQDCFSQPFLFSSAVPCQAGKLMYYGTSRGLLAIRSDRLREDSFVPPLVLTGCRVENRDAAHSSFPVKLGREERNLAFSFAALDYRGSETIRYAMRMDDSGEWMETDSRSALFLDLAPGAHVFSLKSTNRNGLWMDNTLRIPVLVAPRFFETIWGKGLLVTFALALCLAAYCLLRFYFRYRTQVEIQKSLAANRQQLAISSFGDELAAIIEQKLDSPELTVDYLAERMNMGRSTFYNRVKSDTGMSPNAFINEIRLKRAVRLLEEGRMNVSEVAYSVGFSDPKYFTRCFKNRYNISPGSYRKSLIGE